MPRLNAVVPTLVAAIYLAAIVLGLHTRSLDVFWRWPKLSSESSWHHSSGDGVPQDAKRENIRKGMHIFKDTALYAPQYTTSKVSCGDCHAEAGIQPYAIPLIGAPTWFPMFSKRAGRFISLPDRVEECFVRSENGTPLPYDSPEMKAILDYIGSLSEQEPHTRSGRDRGLDLLPEMKADPNRGSAIYAAQCAGCHGDHGQGMPPEFPPLWGVNSFNDGAGMNQVRKMASFVQRNMPQNRTGTLTAQEAFDVSAFIHQQPRPHLNPQYSRF